MLKMLFTSALVFMAATAHAQAPFETSRGRLCLEQWITVATGALNTYNGDREYNSRKPWRVNRFGLFVGEGMYSNYEPDNWLANGANRDTYMWNIYSDEARYPAWSLDILRMAFVPGLRYFVRQCIEDGTSAGIGNTAISGGTSAGTTGTSGTTGGGFTPGGTPPLPTSGGTFPGGWPAIPSNATCPDDLGLLNGRPGVLLGCSCGRVDPDAAVWGSNIYTSDSNLCTAAAHAGVIGLSGGPVWVTNRAGQDAYTGSTRFGIATRDYGSWGNSMVFLNAPVGVTSAPVLPRCPGTMQGTDTTITCICEASATQGGTVWGSGPYTHDSNLCRAAVHAGMIPASGGAITAYPFRFSGTYSGSWRNGVQTSDYGTWENAFDFR